MNTKKKRKQVGDMKEEMSTEQIVINEDGDGDDIGLPRGDIREKEAIGAGVLYLAPEIKGESVNMDLRKLIQVSGTSYLPLMSKQFFNRRF